LRPSPCWWRCSSASASPSTCGSRQSAGRGALSPARSRTRLTLVQAFNSLGTAIARTLPSRCSPAASLQSPGQRAPPRNSAPSPWSTSICFLLHHRGTHCAARGLHLVGARAPAGGCAAAVRRRGHIHRGGPAGHAALLGAAGSSCTWARKSRSAAS
jgi:hypothetical protein